MAKEIIRTIFAALIVAGTLYVALPGKITLLVSGDVVIDQRGGLRGSR